MMIKRQGTPKDQKSQDQKSSRISFVVILASVFLVAFAFAFTSIADGKPKPQPEFIPADAVNASALSTSWVCPTNVGSGSNNSLVLSNPDSTRETNLEIRTFDVSGKELNLSKLKVAPSSYSVLKMGDLKASPSTSIFVESFSGSIAVFRSLSFSDGEELVGCINDLQPSASFPNLTTLRNSNSLIVFSNPFDESVVVDLSANLIAQSTESSAPVLDDIKGQVVPARGKLSLNLQDLFGRFEIASVDVVSRSGFFAAEAYVVFTGANGVTGETITPAAKNVSENVELNWVGVNPTKLVAKNGSVNTHSLNFTALAVDKRSVSPVPLLVPAGTTSLIENLGSDYGVRTVSLSVEKGPNKPRNVYVGWMHASASSLSSGAQEGQLSKTDLLPVTKGDRINIYNPGEKDATISYSILGSKKIFEVKVKAKTFQIVDITDLGLENVTVLFIESSQKVAVSSSNATSSRFAPALEIR